ncbi:hypothetical protein RCL1_002676 [Eukaryota sp. TZLM3-RCL]
MTFFIDCDLSSEVDYCSDDSSLTYFSNNSSLTDHRLAQTTSKNIYEQQFKLLRWCKLSSYFSTNPFILKVHVSYACLFRTFTLLHESFADLNTNDSLILRFRLMRLFCNVSSRFRSIFLDSTQYCLNTSYNSFDIPTHSRLVTFLSNKFPNLLFNVSCNKIEDLNVDCTRICSLSLSKEVDFSSNTNDTVERRVYDFVCWTSKTLQHYDFSFVIEYEITLSFISQELCNLIASGFPSLRTLNVTVEKPCLDMLFVVPPSLSLLNSLQFCYNDDKFPLDVSNLVKLKSLSVYFSVVSGLSDLSELKELELGNCEVLDGLHPSVDLELFALSYYISDETASKLLSQPENFRNCEVFLDHVIILKPVARLNLMSKVSSLAYSYHTLPSEFGSDSFSQFPLLRNVNINYLRFQPSDIGPYFFDFSQCPQLDSLTFICNDSINRQIRLPPSTCLPPLSEFKCHVLSNGMLMQCLQQSPFVRHLSISSGRLTSTRTPLSFNYLRYLKLVGVKSFLSPSRVFPRLNTFLFDKPHDFCLQNINSMFPVLRKLCLRDYCFFNEVCDVNNTVRELHVELSMYAQSFRKRISIILSHFHAVDHFSVIIRHCNVHLLEMPPNVSTLFVHVHHSLVKDQLLSLPKLVAVAGVLYDERFSFSHNDNDIVNEFERLRPSVEWRLSTSFACGNPGHHPKSPFGKQFY